jgi:hypothetical protein
MVCGQFRDGRRLAAADLAEEVFRLVTELVEVGADGEMALGHDKPPTVLPGVRYNGREGGLDQPCFSAGLTGGLGPARGLVASCHARRTVPRGRMPVNLGCTVLPFRWDLSCSPVLEDFSLTEVYEHARAADSDERRR